MTDEPHPDRTRRLMRALHAARGRALTLDELATACGGDTRPHNLAPLVWHLTRRGWLATIPSPWHTRRYVAPRLARTWPTA